MKISRISYLIELLRDYSLLRRHDALVEMKSKMLHIKFLYTKLRYVTQPVNVQLSKTELKRILAADRIPLSKSFRRLSSVLSYVS